MRIAASRLCGLAWLLLIATILSVPPAVWADAGQPAAYRPGPLLTTMLNSDLQGVDEIVFAVRRGGTSGSLAPTGWHWLRPCWIRILVVALLPPRLSP